jgi:lipopolysaccharide/colanic/teichoic acid biosynthesis glycosyltransferase
MFKFRSMVQNAESLSGPTWAEKGDPRVTRIGRLLRRTHLDEVPQFLNVLDGDMSLVGPRPERPFFVEQFLRDIPLYRRRLNVKPGITGWAQVRHKYDESVDDVKTKLRYDLFYIENMSFRMDIKILIQTMYNMFAARGHA